MIVYTATLYKFLSKYVKNANSDSKLDTNTALTLQLFLEAEQGFLKCQVITNSLRSEFGSEFRNFSLILNDLRRNIGQIEIPCWKNTIFARLPSY